MTPQATLALKRESLSTTRLASRLGVQPAQIEARRRAGELLAVRPPGDWEYLYPAWQFNGGGKALPIFQHLLRETRKAGLDERRLYEVLNRRTGLVSAGRVVDLMRAGREEHVVELVRAEGGRR